jgi:hypothetical protein
MKTRFVTISCLRLVAGFLLAGLLKVILL